MSAQRLAQISPAERRFSRLPLQASPQSAHLGQASVRLAAFLCACWWSLRSHVANIHLLPRDQAVGPPPRL